jgi:acyl-CoA thioesterase I
MQMKIVRRLQRGIEGCTIALMLLAGLGVSVAQADTVHIVALGASNTVGVGASSPWPERLEGALRAKGYEVRISNRGIRGDTTLGMLNRLDSAVPEGTRLVILNPANGNDSKAGVRANQGAFVAQIRRRLSARHISLIVLPPLYRIAGDTFVDRQHFSDRGHARIAAYLIPRVIAALGRPR